MSEPDKEIVVEYDKDVVIRNDVSDNDSEEEEQCESDDCEHTFEVDLIDIDPDRAQEITYCTKCFFILKR